MKEAIRLLLKTDKKTYEIAYDVGYNNVKRFVEVFKNSYHMTPVEYRKKNME
jgi:two-component system response regulator YesN